jgi:hypothetical protein
MNFERFFYEVLDNVRRYIESRPLHLGGSSGEAGGEGSRPGGYIGYLPQTRVAYDTSEAATPTTSGSPSLLDNLNHIRYRIGNLETALTYSGLTIQEEGTVVANDVRLMNFIGAVAVEPIGNSGVNIFITTSGLENNVIIPSGICNVNLSSQIDGSRTTFSLPHSILQNSLQVFLNGLQQTPTSVSSNSFQLDFAPQTGDILFVNYDVGVSVPLAIPISHGSLSNLDADDHIQYLNYERAINYFYTKDEVNSLVAPITIFSGLLPGQLGSLIVGNGNGFSKLYHPASGNLILVTDLTESLGMRWANLDAISFTKQIRQQIVFTIAGNNLYNIEVKPIRIYLHQVGDNPKIEEILCYVNTPPSTNNLRLKILKNGSNILTTPNYIEIPVGQKIKTINTGFNDSITYNDYFQLEISQGDITASDLTVHIRIVSEV